MACTTTSAIRPAKVLARANEFTHTAAIRRAYFVLEYVISIFRFTVFSNEQVVANKRPNLQEPRTSTRCNRGMPISGDERHARRDRNEGHDQEQ